MEVNPAVKGAPPCVSAQMPEGQWCSRFQRLNGNVASDLTDGRQVQELLPTKQQSQAVPPCLSPSRADPARLLPDLFNRIDP
jgi:hypothetical protein